MNGCHRFGGTETGLQTAQVLWAAGWWCFGTVTEKEPMEEQHHLFSMRSLSVAVLKGVSPSINVRLAMRR
jgi:hypothetical protein